MDTWHAQVTYESLISIGNGALRFALVVNGIAALSVMAFIAMIYPISSGYPNVIPALTFFLLGMFTAMLAHYTAYKTQLTLYQEDTTLSEINSPKGHVLWMKVTAVLGVSSILCFGTGAVLGVLSITPGS